MRRLWLVVTLLALGTACQEGSLFAPELDKKITEVDASFARGEHEVACARLAQMAPEFGQWAAGAHGERGTSAKALVAELAQLNELCKPPPAGDPTKLAAAWPPVNQELRRISVSRTSWLTVFTYVSMLAVGIGVYLFLRRKQPSEG